jgi:predicted RND superfamily exporter protein
VKELAGIDMRLHSKVINGRETISSTTSLATVLDPEGILLNLPPDLGDEAIRTKFSLIESSPQAKLLNNFWDRKGKQARVLVRISEQQEAADKTAIFAALAGRLRAEAHPDVYVTGLSYLLNKTTEGVISTQWNTIGWSVGSILVMLTLAFGGARLAVLAILPTILAVTMVLGLMGWFGIRLDIATALVGSVALGLSVDDTFHCLLQFRKHRKKRGFREALFASYAVTGPGVLLSSLAVAAGFAVLRFSEFIPFSNFGTMVGIATLGSSVGNLILLPACLALGERRRVRHEAAREFDEASA